MKTRTGSVNLSAWMRAVTIGIALAGFTPLAAAEYFGPAVKPEHAVTHRKFTGIPSLCVTPKGRLWATWYAGPTPAEDCNNYIVLATSADGGDTWKEVLVADPDGKGPRRYFDANLWITPDGRLQWNWAERRPGFGGMWGVNGDQTSVRYGDNPESETMNWTEPVAVGKGVAMGKTIRLSTGEWAMPVSEWFAAPSALMYVSTDAGKTWRKRGGCTFDEPARRFDEHMFVENGNGDIQLYARTNQGMGWSISHDRGKTWARGMGLTIYHQEARFFVTRLKSGRILLVKHGPIQVFERDFRKEPWWLPGKREKLMAFLSEDDGLTWKGGLMIDARNNVSYPDGQQAADGSVYLIHDRERMTAREILCSRFTEEDVLAKKLVARDSYLRKIVSKGSFAEPPPKQPCSSAALADGTLAPADDSAARERLETVPTAPAKYRRPEGWKPSAPYPKTLREIARDHSAETMARAKAQMEKVNAVNRSGKYRPTGFSLDAHTCPEWFVDAKLGMFVDWGLYSIAAYSPYQKGARLYPDWYEYKSRPDYREAGGVWDYHRKNWGEDFKPDHFIALFKGEKFDAPKLMKVFRACGAKYVIPFLKHHSGFCEWDCSYTFRDTVDSPAKRDFTREMADACRAEGLKFGVYTSQADEWEYPILQNDGSLKMRLWGGKTVDWSPDMETRASGKIAVKDFVYEYIVPQMTEFVDRYDPDIMWYDADWMTYASANGSFDITAYMYNRAEGRKEVCCNDRYGKLDPAEEAAFRRKGVKVIGCRTVRGDFHTDEWGDTAENIDPEKWHPWESCSGISKAYGNHWMEELDPSMVMTDREFICYFSDIVARGGNLLLLVNLDAQGALPKVQEDRMRSIGKWLAKNGEAIYATRIIAPYATPSVDYTRAKDGQTVYAIVKEPASEVTLACPLPQEVSVTEISSGRRLETFRAGGALKVRLPADLVASPVPLALRCH